MALVDIKPIITVLQASVSVTKELVRATDRLAAAQEKANEIAGARS